MCKGRAVRRAYLCVLLSLTVVLATWFVMQARAGAPGGPLVTLIGRPWPEDPSEFVVYTVGVGDTLWTIARRYYPDAHIGQVVDAIRAANDRLGPEGPLVRPGDEIWIPDPALYGVGRR